MSLSTWNSHSPCIKCLFLKSSTGGVWNSNGVANVSSNGRCCYFQTPSVVHCMNTTASAQSPKFLPANNFCQLLRVTRKRSCTSAGNAQAQLHFTRSCTSAGNAQAQLHFRDDQQRAFGISNISNYMVYELALCPNMSHFILVIMVHCSHPCPSPSRHPPHLSHPAFPVWGGVQMVGELPVTAIKYSF